MSSFLTQLEPIVHTKWPNSVTLTETPNECIFRGQFANSLCVHCNNSCPRGCYFLIKSDCEVVFNSECCKEVSIGRLQYTDQLKFRLEDGSLSSQPIGKNCEFLGECAPANWGDIDVKQFDVSVKEILPLELTDGVKCLAIQAGMSLGKTLTLEKFLADPGCKEKYPRILMPTPRRVFSCSTMDRFQKHGFVHYLFGEDADEQPDYGFVHVVTEIVKDNVLDRDAKLDKLRPVLQLLADTLREVKNCNAKAREAGQATNAGQTEKFEAYLLTNLDDLVDADKADMQLQNLADFEVAIALESLTRNVSGLANKLKALSLKQQRIFDSNRIIVQYESLHRLRGKAKFDLVILDEARSLVTNACCIKTNHHAKLALNSELLKLAMEQSKLTLCLDANLGWDGAVPHLLSSVFKPKEIAAHHYLFVAMHRTLHATPNEEEFEQELMASIEASISIQGRPVALCCRSRKKADLWAHAIKQKYPDARVELFTGKSHDSQIRQFTNIAGFMETKKPHTVILTSAVTVGSDIRHPFSKVFVDFRSAVNQGCSAQNVFQMIGRFRNVDDDVVRVLYGKPPVFIPGLLKTYDELMNNRRTQYPKQWRDLVEAVMEQKVQLDWLPPNTQVSGLVNPDGTLGIHISPSWFSGLFLLETVDQKQNQDYLFYAHARQSGWKVIVDGLEEQEKKDPKIAKADALSKRKKTQAANKALAEEQECLQRKSFEQLQGDMSCHTYQKMSDVARLAADNGKTGHGTDRDIASVAHILKHFAPVEPDVECRHELHEHDEAKDDTATFNEELRKKPALCTMTFEDYQAVAANKTAIWSLAKHKCEDYTEEDQVRRELNAVAPYFDITSEFAVNQRATMNKLLAKLGVECVNPFKQKDENGQQKLIPLSTFASNEDKILEYANKLATLRGKTPGKQRSAKQKPGMHAKARLSTELCHMYGAIFQEKRGTGNLSLGYAYVPDPTCQKYLELGNFTQLLSQQHRRNRCLDTRTEKRKIRQDEIRRKKAKTLNTTQKR